MAKSTLFLILATVTLFTGQASAAAAGIESEFDDPPMYAVHDYASGQLQARRTIKARNPCDAEFGTLLEAVVTKMEKNKDADEEFANKLRQQFMDLMEKNKDKSLCEKLTWCDMGVCQKRVKLQNRAVEGGGAGAGGEPAPVEGAPVATGPGPQEADASPRESKPKKDETKTDDKKGETMTTTMSTKSAAAREVKFFFTSLLHWAALTVIAILIPRNV